MASTQLTVATKEPIWDSSPMKNSGFFHPPISGDGLVVHGDDDAAAGVFFHIPSVHLPSDPVNRIFSGKTFGIEGTVIGTPTDAFQ
jgi:hypothetical protein